jgi:hypothetical protein
MNARFEIAGAAGPRAGDFWKGRMMMADRDPFEEGESAAREGIPAEANPYQDGSEEHALWAAGHEKVAGPAEAGESEDT